MFISLSIHSLCLSRTLSLEPRGQPSLAAREVFFLLFFFYLSPCSFYSSLTSTLRLDPLGSTSALVRGRPRLREPKSASQPHRNFSVGIDDACSSFFPRRFLSTWRQRRRRLTLPKWTQGAHTLRRSRKHDLVCWETAKQHFCSWQHFTNVLQIHSFCFSNNFVCKFHCEQKKN